MRNVAIGFLGTQLDMGRMKRWKPTVGLCTDPGFPLDRLELLHHTRNIGLATGIKAEIEAKSPLTEVRLVEMNLDDPWDFEEVYGKLFDFARSYGFDEDRERYHVHLTTGTHVAQICWFLLTESRHVPAHLIQTGPPQRAGDLPKMDVIDLDLSRYNALQQRFDVQTRESGDLLRGGIETRDARYNALIDRVELVAGSSDGPILLTGETGSGKTSLARRIYEVKLNRRRVKGRLVQVNCAALRGAEARPMLFGQRRSAMGVAGSERTGALREADGGVLLLDEVDALGWDEQSLILQAIETRRYHPVGADHEVTCRFQVLATAGTDLAGLVAQGRFRPDLFAALSLWQFELPPLRDRRADIEANLTHELARVEGLLGRRVGFNSDAAEAWLRFATDPATPWSGNFRDFGGAVLRLCTLAPRGRITRAMVDEDITALQARWQAAERNEDAQLVAEVLGPDTEVDPFDLVQLAHVLRTCRRSASLSAAGRSLFAVSRAQRASRNDADRLRKYLARFGLDWAAVQEG